MNIRLLIFNIIFYGIVFYLYDSTQRNPSVSLEVAFAGIITFVVFPIIQLILWRTNFFKVQTAADKILFTTATPLIPLLFIILFVAFK